MRRPCRKPIATILPRRIAGIHGYRRRRSVSHNRFTTSRGGPFLRRIATLVAAAAVAGLAVPASAAQKVLRIPYLIAETNFDPATTSDLYSNNITEEIFESPLTYDFLARPAKLKPQTLEALPEITDGGRTYTLKLQKGIYFSDDPAFGGKKRELVAADYEFAFKRLMDPKLASPNLWLIEGRVAGIEEAVVKAKKDRKS